MWMEQRGRLKEQSLGWICGLTQDSQLIRFPGIPMAAEMEDPVQPAVADWSCSALLLSGLFPVPRGTHRLCRKEKIHSQVWSNVQGFSELGVITPLITASHSQATPGLLAQTPGAVMGFLFSLWGKGGSRAEHLK